MGTCGTGLYQDDFTSEVKEYYIDKLKRDAKDKELTIEMIHYFNDYISDQEDGPLFWYALADTQWEYGRLEEEVKSKAMFHLEEAYDLERLEEDTKKIEKRKDVLSDLKEKLLSPQPKRKKVLGYRFFKCEWSIGDVFAYKFESDESKELGFFGKFIMFQKVANTIDYPGHAVPVVRVFKWLAEGLPNIDLINKISVMPSFFAPIVYESKRKDVMYDMVIGYTSKKQALKNLTLIGNLPIRKLDRCGADQRNISWKFMEHELIRTYSKWKLYNVYDILDGKVKVVKE